VGNVGDNSVGRQLSPACIRNATAGRRRTRLRGVAAAEPSNDDGPTCNTPQQHNGSEVDVVPLRIRNGKMWRDWTFRLVLSARILISTSIIVVIIIIIIIMVA